MTRWEVLVLLAALAPLAWGGCGAPGMYSKPGVGDPLVEEVSALRQQQMDRLWTFDKAMSAIGDRCEDLCSHHTQICKLATRICEIARRNPEHARAASACTTANETCRQTNERLPQECWCRE